MQKLQDEQRSSSKKLLYRVASAIISLFSVRGISCMPLSEVKGKLSQYADCTVESDVNGYIDQLCAICPKWIHTVRVEQCVHIKLNRENEAEAMRALYSN